MVECWGLLRPRLYPKRYLSTHTVIFPQYLYVYSNILLVVLVVILPTKHSTGHSNKHLVLPAHLETLQDNMGVEAAHLEILLVGEEVEAEHLEILQVGEEAEVGHLNNLNL